MAGSRRIHALHGVALAVGAIGFVVLVHRMGWAELQRAVVGAGAWFLAIAAIDLASMFCDAAGIQSLVRPRARVPYLRVFAAQASGVAINRLTPGNSLGEPIKATMVMEAIAANDARTTAAPTSRGGADIAVSAIVKYNLATLYVSLAVIVLGVPLTLATIDLPGRIQVAVWIATAVLIAIAIALALLVRRGALATLIDAALRLGWLAPERADRWRARTAAIDAEVRSFSGPATRRALCFVALSRALYSAGSLVAIHAAEVPLTAPLVIGTLSVGILITWMSNVVPLGFGLADGGNYLFYAAVGSSPTGGLDFAIVNRTRTVVLATMGLVVMAIANLVDRRGDRARLS
ncbi:MAG: lysylphosphatidylglycerol synthase domain-containing protein [Kofleriaceae bacterium]